MGVGISVLIVDDHAGFRSFARRLLESSGFVVAGEAEDGNGAMLVTRELKPDVVMLDIQLPDIDGFEVARRMVRCGCPCSVVFVSSREAADYGERLALSEVAGFIWQAPAPLHFGGEGGSLSSRERHWSRDARRVR